MTLIEHFLELKKRLIFIIICFFITFILGWIISPYLEEILTQPLLYILDETEFLYSNLTDGLFIKFSLSTSFALFLTFPVLFFQIWKYLSPGLLKKEKKVLLTILFCSPILFIIGVLFSFYVLLPLMFNFFIQLNNETSIPSVLMPITKDYLLFALKMLKSFGIVFQLPLIIILLNLVNIITYETIKNLRRYVYVFIFIVSAILTPPDVLSQIILAIPMILLFEISLLIIRRLK